MAGPLTAPVIGRPVVARVLEATLLASIGAVLGAIAGSLIGFAVPVAVVAGANGAISGWRGSYMTNRIGMLAFALDSTWATLPVAGSLVSHAVAAARRHTYEPSLTLRQNRHVYRRGLTLKRGFAFTIGNTISGAGDVDRPRRRRLITDHEDVHVWQCRGLGPIYPLFYLGWFASGALVGLAVWLRRRRAGASDTLPRVIETCAYYLNPLEWWAYSRDDHWPPAGKVAGIGWKRPAARPLASLERRIRRRASVDGATLDE
jgi:hypothetical protein